jgi:hypothetical protein
MRSPLKSGLSFCCQDSGSFGFVDVFLSALLGAKMNRSKFQHPPVIPPIVKGELPAKASSGLHFEIRSEYPLFSARNYIRRSLTPANVASDHNHH